MGLRIAPGTRRIVLIVCVVLQFVLLYLGSSALLGRGVFYVAGQPVYPLFSLLAALASIAIFVLPSVIGLFCRRWQTALVLALLPWWLTVIAHAGTFFGPRFGGGPIFAAPFWLDSALLGVLLLSLALFAALGALGWLAGVAWASRAAPEPAG